MIMNIKWDNICKRLMKYLPQHNNNVLAIIIFIMYAFRICCCVPIKLYFIKTCGRVDLVYGP